MVEIDYYKNVSKQVSTNETTKNRENKKKKKKPEKFHCGSRAIQKIMPKAAKMETIIKYLWSEWIIWKISLLNMSLIYLDCIKISD